jgi:hypothetical protein
MRSTGAAWLAGALVGSSLLLPALGGAAQAQTDAPSAEQLIERLRQIQGSEQAEAGQAGAPSAEGMIERLRQIGAEVGTAQAPAPRLSEDQVRARLQDELGVDVLDLRTVEVDGRPGYAAKVMNPPGNYNAAFLVSTLLVDGDTGQVLGEMRPQPSVAVPDVLPESRRPELDASGAEIRRRTYR